MHTITALDLKAILQRIQERGAVDSAHRVLQLCGQVFRYAMAGHQAERNPAADLKGWLPSPARTRFATITEPQAIGALIRALDGYPGSFPVRCALRLAAGPPADGPARRIASSGMKRIRLGGC